MGKPKSRTRKPGAIGPDRLSNYARKCKNREAAAVESDSTQLPLADAKATAVTPTTVPDIDTEQVRAVFWGISDFLRAETGEELFLPWRVLKESGFRLRKRELVLCRVTDPAPGHKRRMIVSLKPIA